MSKIIPNYLIIYERHGTTKHGNTVSEWASVLTTNLLAGMVNSAVQSIKERKVFNLSLKNELTVFIFETEERSAEFLYLKTIYGLLRKKEDVEKLRNYGMQQLCCQLR